MTLLKRALKRKTIPHLSKQSPQDLELAIAWFNDTIGIGQVAYAWNLDNNPAYCRLATTLKAAHKKGLI